MRGKDLKDAEQWLLESAQAKDRQPTALQSSFIGASAQAQNNERQAISRLLAAQAAGGMERNLNLSLLLAVAAYQRAPTFEARQALRSVIEARPHLSKYLYGHSQRIRHLTFDSSGTLLASSVTTAR